MSTEASPGTDADLAELIARGERGEPAAVLRLLSELSGVAAAAWAVPAAVDGEEKGRHRLQQLMPELLSAANSGDSKAQCLLGAAALEIDEDFAAAAHWFGLAAEARFAEGLRGLGLLYMAGAGVERDLARAAEFFGAAAELGDGVAAFNLSVCCSRGLGVPVDQGRAWELMQLAADLGRVEADAEIADRLAGEGRREEALGRYVTAAAGGHVDAALTAARWFRDGVGTTPDPVQALRWFLDLMSLGDMSGVHECHLLAATASVEQILEAGRLARQERYAETLAERRRGN
ncbi:tetratricopeptide repeat protein [Kitasatospora sp. NPDC048365]|uniref:tetratricopeptide repeat protein n=1 Tax=Kitasatospora sp. NPDC048365 TaxID=3364050 RepID=UPI003714AC05